MADVQATAPNGTELNWRYYVYATEKFQIVLTLCNQLFELSFKNKKKQKRGTTVNGNYKEQSAVLATPQPNPITIAMKIQRSMASRCCCCCCFLWFWELLLWTELLPGRSWPCAVDSMGKWTLTLANGNWPTATKAAEGAAAAATAAAVAATATATSSTAATAVCFWRFLLGFLVWL